MKDSVFNFVFNRMCVNECPPSEGNKKKQEGCFNALNDYGKEPKESACKRCWREYLESDS